jgi:uncharacterized small protein (DUF1192 family)
MDLEDLEPRKKATKPRDLDAMGIEELDVYLAELEAEALRVKAAIEGKKSYLTGAESFFKS